MNRASEAPVQPRPPVWTKLHLVGFLACWFPLNPLALSVYRIGWMDRGPAVTLDVNAAGQLVGMLASTITGPFTAALEGRNRPDCLTTAWWLLPWCGGAVAAGTLLQAVWRPKSRFARIMRHAIWLLGWQLWFGGAFLSILSNSG